MGFNSTAVPSGWVTITTAKRTNVFSVGDALTFAFDKTGATAYTVRDYWGSVVASGTPSGLSLTLPALNPGWYRLYLTGPGNDATYGSALGVTSFCVIVASANLIANPAAGTVASNDADGTGADHIVRGLAVLGPHRNSIDSAAAPTTGTNTIAAMQAELVYEKSWWSASGKTDAARPRENFLLFGNGSTGTGQPAGVTQVVAALYPDVKWFEGPSNEPQGIAAATVAAQMQTFHDAVKAGNANAKVLGPCIVSANGSTIAWLDAFLAAGGGSYLDGLSFHTYNCFGGDVVLARRTMDALVATLTSHGVEGLPRFATESTAYFGARYGVLAPRHQARRFMFETLMLDQYGVTKERTYAFYDTSHGFWDFPSFWKMGDGSLFPVIPMMRTFSAEVFAKTYTSAFTFPAPKSDWCVGNLYTDAVTGAKTAAFLTSGRTDESLTFVLAGATSVTVVDCFGNTSTLTADGTGRITLGVAEVPVYVRLPAGVTLTLDDAGYGTNLTTWGVIVASTGDAPKQSIADTVLENSYYQGGAVAEWKDASGTLPLTITLDLGRNQNVDAVVVECPEPWQTHSTLLDFDVQTLDANGSTWTTKATVTEPPNTVAFVSPLVAGGALVESYFSDRCVFVATFALTNTRKVRLVIRDCTYGGEPTLAAANSGGQGDSARHVCIRDVKVFSRDTLITRPVRVSV